MLFLCFKCSSGRAPSLDFTRVATILDHSASCDSCGSYRTLAYAFSRTTLT